jgi:hypothetical protein
MVVREERTGVSGGFHIGSVSVHDADGTALDVEKALERQEDPSLFFYVQRSILQEVSLCSMPADPNAIVRACGLDAECWRMIRQGEATLRRILHPGYDRDDDDDELMRARTGSRDDPLWRARAAQFNTNHDTCCASR